MLKKTIKYTDFNDDTLTEDFYFNLTKAEIVEMNVSEKGGLEEYMKIVVASDDNSEILRIFKEIIKKSYGKKSPDGKRFQKDPEFFQEFEESGAYSELIMEMFQDAAAGAGFIRGIMPKDLADQLPEDGPKTPQDRKKKTS